MSSWEFEEADNALSNWSSISQFDDMVWDDFGESDDHIVPERSSPMENGWGHNVERRKRQHRDPGSMGSSKGMGQVSQQRHGGSHVAVGRGVKEESSCALEEQMVQQGQGQGQVQVQEEDREELEFEEGSVGFGHEEGKLEGDGAGAGELEEPAGGLLSEDIRMYMDNSGFPSDDGTLMEATCPFPLPDVGSTEDMELFVSAGSDVDKGGNLLDYSWENIDNLEDVDKLFRNSDASFGQTLNNSAEALPWTVSPPRLQGSNGTATPAGVSETAPSGLDFAAVKSELGAYDVETDFVSCDDSLMLSTLEKQDEGLKESEFVSAPSLSSQMQHSAVEQSSEQSQPTAALVAEERDARVPESSGLTVEPSNAAVSKVEENNEGEAGPSTVSGSDADKAGLAQAHRARRHAANRKRNEERLRRQFPPRKLAQSPVYPVPHLTDASGQKGLQVRLPAQVSHLPPGALHGYPPAPPPSPSMMIVDPHMQSSPRGVSYIHPAYGPPFHHVPLLVNTSSSTPPPIHPSQQTYVGYQQLSPHGQKAPLDQPQFGQQKQLRQQLEVPLRPPPASSPTMTPQEKLEKLRWRQQIQARLAVQQQQQLVAQQIGLEQLRKQQQPQQPQQQQPQQQSVSLSQPLADNQEVVTGGRPSNGSEAEQDTVGVSHDSAQDTSMDGEEDDSLEAVVLRELERTMQRLDINTRVCIRDALYRLAMSAMQRRSAGDSGSSSASSDGLDSVPGGVESSSGSNLPSSARTSRVGSLNLVETETNPIDRSIANLLFHKRVLHPAPYYVPVPPGGGPYALPPPQPPGGNASP